MGQKLKTNEIYRKVSEAVIGRQVEIKSILTDGACNRGGDSLNAAVRFDKLSVIGFPPAKREKILQLAVKGDGNFSFVEDETEIACAILECLN